MSGDRKCQSEIHARRIMLDGCFQELFHFRKRNDFVKLAFDFLRPHSQDSAIQEYVLAPGQVRMKTGSNFQQRAQMTVNIYFSRRRFGYPSQNSKEGRLAGTITSDDPDDFAGLGIKTDVLESPKSLLRVAVGPAEALHE